MWGEIYLRIKVAQRKHTLGEGLDSRGREERDAWQQRRLLDPDTSPTPSHSITQVKTLFLLGELEGRFLSLNANRVWIYPSISKIQIWPVLLLMPPDLLLFQSKVSTIIQFLLPRNLGIILDIPFSLISSSSPIDSITKIHLDSDAFPPPTLPSISA